MTTLNHSELRAATGGGAGLIDELPPYTPPPYTPPPPPPPVDVYAAPGIDQACGIDLAR